MKLSIIIPAHNEEKRIEKTLIDYASFFQKKYKKDFEIIVVLNGCIDNTLKVVKKAKKKYLQIRYLDFKQSGKGFAIIEGFKVAKGDLIGFADADDSASAEEFNKLTSNMTDFDGAIASRYLEKSIVNPKQPIQRIIASRIFNLIVRLLFLLPYHDTQLGAKLFRKNAINKILPNIRVAEWAFDVDLLYQAKQSDLKIKEVPITWENMGGSKLDLGRISLQMLISLIKLRLK